MLSVLMLTSMFVVTACSGTEKVGGIPIDQEVQYCVSYTTYTRKGWAQACFEDYFDCEAEQATLGGTRLKVGRCEAFPAP